MNNYLIFFEEQYRSIFQLLHNLFLFYVFYLGCDGVDQIALVIVGLADPIMSSLLPILLRDIEDQQSSRTVSEIGVSEMFVVFKMKV